MKISQSRQHDPPMPRADGYSKVMAADAQVNLFAHGIASRLMVVCILPQETTRVKLLATATVLLHPQKTRIAKSANTKFKRFLSIDLTGPIARITFDGLQI